MIDMRAEVAALARHRDAVPQNAPLTPHFVTFHYSAVAYSDRTFSAERPRVLQEARYHLAKNWRPAPKPGERAKPPIYGSRYQYHYVVFSNGEVAQVNDLVQLWHCGNATGNRESLAVHVMLGGEQDLTPQQRASVFALFGQLRGAHGIASRAVVGHCEWPRNTGQPEVRPQYHIAAGQSECPGRILFRAVAGYRDALAPLADPAGPASPAPPASGAGRYRVRFPSFVRSGPSLVAKKIGELAAGDVVEVQQLLRGGLVENGLGSSNEWAELADGRYVWARQLVKL